MDRTRDHRMAAANNFAIRCSTAELTAPYLCYQTKFSHPIQFPSIADLFSIRFYFYKKTFWLIRIFIITSKDLQINNHVIPYWCENQSHMLEQLQKKSTVQYQMSKLDISDAKAKQALDDVSNSKLTYALLKHDGTSNKVIVASTCDDVRDLIDDLNDGTIMYALIRFVINDATKFVYVVRIHHVLLILMILIF